MSKTYDAKKALEELKAIAEDIHGDLIVEFCECPGTSCIPHSAILLVDNYGEMTMRESEANSRYYVTTRQEHIIKDMVDKQKPLPLINVHPGEFLKESLSDKPVEDLMLGIRKELLTISDYDKELEQYIQLVLSGKALITEELGLDLDCYFNSPGGYWKRLSDNYEETEKRMKEREKEEIENLKAHIESLDHQNSRDGKVIEAMDKHLQEAYSKNGRLREGVRKLRKWIPENVGKPNPSCWQCVNTVLLEEIIEEYFPEVK